MARIVGISGSLRRGSYNSALLRAAAALMPAESELVVATIAGIPLYDGDVEASEGIPTAVARLKDVVVAADGLLLATPEYNNSVSGVFKNAIDWLSRPPSDAARVFAGSRVAIVGASPGGFGTILSQNAWLPILRTLGCELWTGGRLLVSRAAGVFDADGALVDAKVAESLRSYLAGYVAWLDATHEPAKKPGPAGP